MTKSNDAKYDWIIVGSGIAGFSAAITLHSEGKKVGIVSQTSGATSVSSGAWDFGPISSNGPQSFAELRETQWWKSIFSSCLTEDRVLYDDNTVVQLFPSLESHLTDTGLKFFLNSALCLPNTQGYWKRTLGAQGLQANSTLELLKKKRVRLVSSPSFRFQSAQVCRNLVERASAMGVTLDLSLSSLGVLIPGGDCSLSHFAVRLKNDLALQSQFRESLAKVSKESGAEMLLFPPLFLDLLFVKQLEQDTGALVCECLATQEPIPGERLRNAMERALNKVNIPIVYSPRISVTTKGKRITNLSFDSKSGVAEWSADSFVLATGKFLGGGISLGFDKVSESVLDLPVFTDRSTERIHLRNQLAWEDRRFEEDQIWAKLGVWVNKEWTPIDRERVPPFENLRACGSVLGGVDFARQNIGLGFMAYSGARSVLAKS